MIGNAGKCLIIGAWRRLASSNDIDAPATQPRIRIKAVGRDQQIGSRLEGQPSQIFIKQAADTGFVELAGADIEFDVALRKLEQRLKELVKQKAITNANLKIEGDSDLRQRYIMEVYDTCKKAGFDKLHFVPPPVMKTKLMK